MTSPSTIALLGGPESGKTTYLGVLIDALQSGRPKGLKLRAMPADARAYDRLAEPLYEGHYPQRTKAERHVLELPLRASRDGCEEDVTLTVGDYDGEEVERLFQDRTSGFSPEWRSRAGARGLLLFLRPDAMAPLPKLRHHAGSSEGENWRSLRGDAGEAMPARSTSRQGAAPLRPENVFGPGIAEEPTGPPPAAATDPVRVPTVLAAIELLQFLRHVRGLAPGERPPPGDLRVALLTTAWDSTDKRWRDAGPRRFFVEQAPMLDDFLWSNFHQDDIHCFGLSSTGGDLRNDRYREEYLNNMGGYVEWTDITGAVKRSTNIALPISWLLVGDESLTDAE